MLDVDDHGQAGNGFTAYRQLDSAGLLDDAGAIVATPGGGLHVYFVGSRQGSGRLPRHHLDFQAVGGYVLVPPSRVNRKEYRLIRYGARLGSLDWSAVTDLLDKERRRADRSLRSATVDIGRLAAWVGQLEEGNRNCGLFWAACRAVEAGQLSMLGELAAAAARTGLPEPEISRTIASARHATTNTLPNPSQAQRLRSDIGMPAL